MNERIIVDILNELLAAERRSLVARLQESTVYISGPSMENAQPVDEMVRASREHSALLTDAILQLGGSPGLRIGDVRSADLHYLELQTILPRLAADREALIQKYTAAMPHLSEHPKALTLAQRIMQRHQADLARLQRSNRSPVEPRA